MSKNNTGSRSKKKKVGAKVLAFPGGGVVSGAVDWDAPFDDPLSRAQDLVYDAWEEPTRNKAIALAKKALNLSADCADAYTLLAEEAAKSLEEAQELYGKGLEAGERVLGAQFFKEEEGYFWGILKSRPYMRARFGLAWTLWKLGRKDEAMVHYQEMLRLNPNDNQGIRYIVLPVLIQNLCIDAAEKLYNKYDVDFSACWAYSKALLDFRKYGNCSTSTKSLNTAFSMNKHVPAYLLGRKKMPIKLPEFEVVGSDDEAVVYVFNGKESWEAIKGALEWLRDSL